MNPSTQHYAYRVEWNGEEYVATATGYHNVSGHSREPVHALAALVRKMREIDEAMMWKEKQTP